MTALPMEIYFSVSMSILAIGFYILATKRNILRMLLGIELMITGANMTFVIISYWLGNGIVDPLVRSIVIISIGIASVIVAVAISLVIFVYRKFGTQDIRKLRELKW